MRILLLALLTVATLFNQPAHCQIIVPSKTDHPWTANWIALPGETGADYGVYYFRKQISLGAKPQTFKVNVSADNRYKLFVNGALVSLGPARGDLYNWNYETLDIANYLKAGKNLISAVIWNEAQYRPEAQLTFRTGFILQGAGTAEDIVNTNNTWKCIRDDAYRPMPGYGVAAAGEFIDMQKSVRNPMLPETDDSKWTNAGALDVGHPKGSSDGFGWMLVPSQLPQMELTNQRIPAIRKVTGVDKPRMFPNQPEIVTIPANSTATLLLDQTYETNAYITLKFSGGKGAGISLSYAESLFDNLKKFGSRKSNRDEVDGKDFSGRKDSLVSDGSIGQSFTSLYWRTFRYLQVVVTTKDEPLVISDLYGTFTGYPFKQLSSINTDNPEINQILDIGWRTARLNAMETYWDCPYYEQLQYIGDTRIQAMISYYNTPDDRLARNALNLMDQSRLTEGVTMSRWPTHSTQVISTFSLWYIGMLYDYWMYRPDAAFIKNKLNGSRAILDFFAKYQQADGSLKDTPYWTFVDWANGKNWVWGSPPRGTDGAMAILDLQLLSAYQEAAKMEAKFGLPALAQHYAQKAAQLKQTIQKKYWNPAKGLYADTKAKDSYSQHVNALAILAGLVDAKNMDGLCKKLQSDTALTQCTIYFRYYLHQALAKGGLADHYSEWLDIWRNNIKMGLTTWAEESNLQSTRSDCHAWGSSPNIEYFRTVLGIDSDAPGFSRVKISPHLGTIKRIGGEMFLPHGLLKVDYQNVNNKWHMTVDMPAATPGTFLWKGKAYPLKTGVNKLVI